MTVLAIVQCWNKDDPARGFTVGWIEALADEAGHVIVLALEKRHESTDPRIEVFSLGKDSYDGPFRHIRYLLAWHHAMRKITTERRPDFIFTHMAPLYSVLAYPYARFLKIPIITWFLHPRGSWLLRLAHAVSYRVVSASSDSYPFPDAKLIPIGHGIDTDFFVPGPLPRQFPPLIISVGRITPIKNIELLIDAVSLLKESSPCRVAVIGSPFAPADAAYMALLRRRVADKGMKRRFDFVPAVSRDILRDWYRRATLHVNCTEAGSGDKVILEAMACGTPSVFVSPVFKEVCGPYAEELYCSVPLPAALVLAIEPLLHSSRQSTEIGVCVRQNVISSYSIRQCMHRLIEVYAS